MNNAKNDKHCIIWGCHCDEEGDQICRTYIIPLESLHPKETVLFIGNSWQDCHDQLYVPIEGNRLNTRQVNIPLLLNKAAEYIQDHFPPETDEFIFLESIDEQHFKVGYLQYYTEEGIYSHDDLTEEDIGKPCGYWEMRLEIDSNGDVSEGSYGNYDPDEHPNWQQIVNKNE